MARFAQIIDGVVTNPCDGETLEAALSSSFAADWVKRQPIKWVKIADGVIANSRQRPDGGFDAPAVQVTSEAASVAPLTVEELAQRVDAMGALLERIAQHLGVETGVE